MWEGERLGEGKERNSPTDPSSPPCATKRSPSDSLSSIEYACMYACMYASMHVCMYACMYVGMYACVYVCMYACYTCAGACMGFMRLEPNFRFGLVALPTIFANFQLREWCAAFEAADQTQERESACSSEFARGFYPLEFFHANIGT